MANTRPGGARCIEVAHARVFRFGTATGTLQPVVQVQDGFFTFTKTVGARSLQVLTTASTGRRI
jgi:hypothetical protein